MLQIIKARDRVQTFSSAQQVSQPTPQNSVWKQGAHRDNAGVFQGHHPVRRMVRVQVQRAQKTHYNQAPISTANVVTSSTLLITDKASEEEACGCSTRESPGMNSSPWPPSPASLSGDQSAADSLQQGWRVGWTLETRCHLSLEHLGTKHPITYLTSCPRVTG